MKHYYRLVTDENGHPGILCIKKGEISWNPNDIQTHYCVFHHEKFTGNSDLHETDFHLSGTLFYYWHLFFNKQALYHEVTDECPRCDESSQRGDFDPVAPGVQSKLSLKLKKVKDPKKRADLWLENIKK